MFKALAVLPICFCFFVLFLLFLGIFNARITMFDAGFYKDHLLKSNIYERAYTDLLPAFVEPNEENKAIGFFGNLEERIGLTDADIESLARQLFPPEFIRSNSERFVDEIVAYAKNDTDTLDLTLDLRRRKARAPAILLEFVGKRFDTLRDCTGGLAAEIREMEKLTQGGDLPSCFPAQAALQTGLSRASVKSTFTDTIETEVRNTVDREVPDVVDLVQEAADQTDQTREEFLEDLDDARPWMSFTLSWGLVLCGLLLAMLLGLIGLLYRTSPRTALRWAGTIVFLSALVPLIGFLAARGLDGEIRESLEEDASLKVAVVDVIATLGESMYDDLSGDLILQSSLAVGIGLALLVLSFLPRLVWRSPITPAEVEPPLGSDGNDEFL